MSRSSTVSRQPMEMGREVAMWAQGYDGPGAAWSAPIMATVRRMIHVAGPIAVEAVLQGGVRQVERVLVGPNRRKGVDALLATCRNRAIPIEEVSDGFLATLDSRPGGIVAEVGERSFLAPDALWDEPLPFVAHMDGVEDPFNFGQAVRTLYASGSDGVLLPERNWMTATATVTRSSAGASEFMPMAIQSATDAVEAAISRGVAVIATSDRAERDIHEVDLSRAVLVLFGGEKRGVTRSLLSRVETVRIPYGRQFPRSLGTVAATSVVAFEVMRQRNQGRQILADR